MSGFSLSPMAWLVRSCLLVGVTGVSAVQSLSSCIGHEMSFDDFIKRHGRAYEAGSAEYEARQKIFKRRASEVRSQNCAGHRAWRATINKFSDLSGHELEQYRGWKSSRRQKDTAEYGPSLRQVKRSSQNPLPSEVDWTHLHAIRNVRDQGSCGSCWAFAAATVLSAHHEIHQRQNRSYSVQQMVACVPNPEECGGTGGCNGATAELAFEYVLRSGSSTEEEFPYTQVDSACPSSLFQGDHTSTGGHALGMTGWSRLAENEMQPLMRALYEKGPVAVAVGVTDAWYSYQSGIMDACSPDVVVNHAVTVVGYGTSNGAKFWNLLNSWGRDFGQGGYFRLARFDSETEHCGWDDAPLDGIECAHGTEPPRERVWVCGMCGVLYDMAVPEFSSADPPEAALLQMEDSGLLLPKHHLFAAADSDGEVMVGGHL